MAAPASSTQLPTARYFTQRILVVDDRPTTREILELTLRRLGYRAVGAASGHEALGLLEAELFDLVITDLLMPRMSGLELLFEIRRRFSRTELPVIILTVKEEGEDLVAAMRGGANDYVTKPIKYPVLLARLETQLTLRDSILDLERAKATAEARSAALEQANRELDVLGSRLSGELRHPLSHIRSVVRELLGKGSSVSESAREQLRSVAGSAIEIDGLLTGLGHFAHATGKVLTHDRVDLTGLALEIWREFETTRNRTASQPTFAPTNGLVAHGDERLVRLLLENLLDNAWKFTASRANSHIELGLMVRDGRRVHFVADDGMGFEPSGAERMFRPCERLHDSETIAGAGMGLAIVDRIARRHGGAAWAEGRPGEGATVYFTLEGLPKSR